MADSERLALSLPENRLSENVKPQHLARAKLPKEWIDKFKGKFDQGWDKVREETLARQKQMGIVPQNTLLAPKPAGTIGKVTVALKPQPGAARQPAMSLAQKFALLD